MMDITEVVPVYDTISNILGVTGFLCFIVGVCLLVTALTYLLSGEYVRSLVWLAIAVACIAITFGADALMHEPTIRYKAVIYNMEEVGKQYNIISAEHDGTYIVEPKQDGGAE